MRLRSWRGSTPLSDSPKRPFPWVRLTLIVALIALLAYIFVPNYFYLRADALVQGDLIPVTPIYRVRVDKVLVQCNDHVRAGQHVAIVSNFLVEADYQRQYLQSAQSQELSEIALDQSVTEARSTAESLHQKYLAAVLDQQRVAATVKSYDEAYAQGAIPRIEWQDKHGILQSDVAATESARQAWQRAQQEVARIESAQTAKLESDRELAHQASSLAQQVGSQPLLAPVSGYIVDCVLRPQNVLEPGSALFNIYSPQRAFVIAYFDPNSVSKVHLGQKADVAIAGLPRAVQGHIVAIYPDLSKLPPQLTKFFWQHVQFSEFRPVKIALDGVNATEREQLYYGAQARVTIPLRGSRDGGSVASSQQ